MAKMEVVYRDDVRAELEDLFADVPGIEAGKSFGHPAFKTGSKVFLFVGGDGIAIKLPEGRVAELVSANDNMRIFEPVDGTVWKSWVSIERIDAEDYRDDLPLFEESIQFVSAG